MDDTDFDLLIEGLPPEQAKRMRKILVEWCDGDESGFPVQLALLTRAQWLMAASVPRSVNDASKLLETHQAEHLRQIRASLLEFAKIAGKQSEELKAIVTNHATTAKQVTETIRAKIGDAATVAEQTKILMGSATAEWLEMKSAVRIQCEQLQTISNEFQDRFAWRQILWAAFWLMLVFGFGLCLGHYAWAK
jgi:hypothetical protein